MQKPFGLAQGQVKEQPECDRGLDGEIGIDRLGTSLAGLWRCPCVNGALTDPQRQAHAAEIYPRYRGKPLCIAGEALFVADTPEEAWPLATAAYPEDDGQFLYYVPRKALARIYAD